MKVQWKKVGSGYDISYVGTLDGQKVAEVYRGGDRYYPWSTTMPGHKVGNSLTLGNAKDSVQRIVDNEAAAAEAPARRERIRQMNKDPERAAAIRLAEAHVAGFENSLRSATDRVGAALAAQRTIQRDLSRAQMRLMHLKDGGLLDDLPE